jgi:hypothetical protein
MALYMQNYSHKHNHINGSSLARDEPVKKGEIDMPFGNGTGPAGTGPMTGRAAGYCAGYNMPGFANPIPGRSFRGRGGRRGSLGRRGAWFGAPYYQAPAYGFAPYSPEQNLYALKAQAQHLQNALEEIHKRVADLEKEGRS